MNRSLVEKYSWMTPELTSVVDSGKRSVKIKGVALRSGAISRNNRKYVDDELKKAARTWIGKPVTINHDPSKIAGTVEWMEHDADGNMEYVAVVNKQPYVDMVRMYGRNPQESSIVGVSVEAAYLHNQCPIQGCGRRFYTEIDFHKHMHEEHFIKTNPLSEPHGLLGQALSLVISPEVPGVSDTTIELMETVQNNLPKLFETIITEEEEKVKQSLPYNTKETQTPKPLETQVPRTEPENKPEPPRQPIEAAAMQVVEQKAKKKKQIPKLKLDEEAPKLTLGEPFAGYADFADCVAKNKDKDNPEAYCGQIKHQAEGETFIHRQTAEVVNTLIDELDMLDEELEKAKADFKEAIGNLPKDDTSWNAKIDETAKRIPDLTPLEKELAELGKRIPDITPIEKAIAELRDPKNLETFKKSMDDVILGLKKDFEIVLAAADENIVETRRTLEEQLKKLNEDKQALEKKVADADKKKVKETEDLTIRLDNVEDKVGKGEFKGKTKMEQAMGNGENTGLPYKP